MPKHVALKSKTGQTIGPVGSYCQVWRRIQHNATGCCITDRVTELEACRLVTSVQCQWFPSDWSAVRGDKTSHRLSAQLGWC